MRLIGLYYLYEFFWGASCFLQSKKLRLFWKCRQQASPKRHNLFTNPKGVILRKTNPFLILLWKSRFWKFCFIPGIHLLNFDIAFVNHVLVQLLFIRVTQEIMNLWRHLTSSGSESWYNIPLFSSKGIDNAQEFWRYSISRSASKLGPAMHKIRMIKPTPCFLDICFCSLRLLSGC